MNIVGDVNLDIGTDRRSRTGAPPSIAGLLLAGLLSDTLILTSPTTASGMNRADRLARWAFVPVGVENETINLR